MAAGPSSSLPASPLQDEITELRRRLAVVTHQADQLKGEIAARDSSLQKEKYDHAKVGLLLEGEVGLLMPTGGKLYGARLAGGPAGTPAGVWRGQSHQARPEGDGGMPGGGRGMAASRLSIHLGAQPS